jgi:Tol biopolymer transport system component
MKKILLICYLLVCSVSNSFSQDKDFPKLTGPYLGQKPPGTTAEIFAPGIVSTKEHEHSRLVFSQDGTEMYWAVVTGEEQKIWCTRNSKDGWSKPEPLPLSFTETRAPVITADGKYLYFFSNDPDSAAGEMPPKSLLWIKNLSDTSWKNIKPVSNIIPQIGKRMTMSFSFASNGNLYFDLGGPNETGRWGWQIYFSEFKNGRYSEPQLMDGKINEGNINQFPFIAPDESYLIFSSNREGNLGGGDLYISFKDKNGKWMNPVNMGDKINTPGQERSPSVSPDGKYFFFTRHNRETLQDFYWIDAKIIEELKSQIIINGKFE